MRHLGLTLPLLLPYAALGINCWLRQHGLPRHLIVAFLVVDLVLLALYLLRPMID